MTSKLAERTADVAEKTHELAQDTVAASRLADQHHQESLQPLVRFVGKVWAFPTQPGWCAAHIEGELVNIGLGIATDCEVSIGFGETHKAGPIGKDDRVSVKLEISFGWQREHTAWPWHLILTYKNFVGAPATTDHFHTPGKLPDEYSTVYTPPIVINRL